MDGETIFAILVGVALALFSLVMVAYSFFEAPRQAPGRRQASTQAASHEDDGVGLDSIYDSIDTLELEYQLGNLPEEQYREQLQLHTGLRGRCRHQGAVGAGRQRRRNCCWSRK